MVHPAPISDIFIFLPILEGMAHYDRDQFCVEKMPASWLPRFTLCKITILEQALNGRCVERLTPAS